MTWKSSKGAASPKSGGANTSRYGPESALQRLVRFVAEEVGVHAFIHRATADQGVVEEARSLTRMLLGGQDIPEPCRQLCQHLGVDESLLRTRLWAVASLLPDQQFSSASPYEILGVEPWAEQDVIKRAFRTLCLKWHPDHNQDNPEAVTRFRQIKAAYDMVNDSAAAQGWGPPAGLNVWEEPGPCEEKRTWPRLRRLTPLAVVVGLLVLAVGVADLVVLYPRPRSASRETSRNENVLSGTKITVGDDGAHHGDREPLVLPGETSGQSAVATGVQSEIPATGNGGNSSDAVHGSPAGNDGVAGRPASVAPDAEGGGTHVGAGAVARGEVPVESETAPGPSEVAGSDQAPKRLPDEDKAGSGVGRHEESRDIQAAPGSGDRGIAAGKSEPSAPDGAASEMSVNGTDRGVSIASPLPARKRESQGGPFERSQNKLPEPLHEQMAQSLTSPPAEPSPTNDEMPMVALSDVEERLEKFLAAYVRDYSRRDLGSFLRHFAPSALENGTPLTALHPLYEENFRNIPTMRYSIVVDTFSVGSDRVHFAGRFELRGLHSDGEPIASRGTLNMDLEPFETTFRVRKLEYAFR